MHRIANRQLSTLRKYFYLPRRHGCDVSENIHTYFRATSSEIHELLMPKAKLVILHEDNHLLVVNKPVGLPTMGVAKELPSLLSQAKADLKRRYDKPGNVYLGVVSRLDTPVSGVVLLAKTSKAAARLCEQFRERKVRKTYWAVVEGLPAKQQEELHTWLRKDERHRRVHVSIASAKGAQEAILSYSLTKRFRATSLLEIELLTGRKHQIRVQFAHIKHPIVGDRKYGSNIFFPQGIALHARSVRFQHPVQKNEITIQAPLPDSWSKWHIGS